MARSKSPAKAVGVPTIASQVDAYFTARNERLAAQKSVDAMQKREKELKDWLIENIPKSEATGVAGKLARATVIRKEKPVVEDWDAFYKHVKKTGEFELLQRRLTESAVAERWEDGVAIPGVVKFGYVDVSINKV